MVSAAGWTSSRQSGCNMIPSGKRRYSSHMGLLSKFILEEEKYLWVGPFNIDFVSEKDGTATIQANVGHTCTTD